MEVNYGVAPTKAFLPPITCHHRALSHSFMPSPPCILWIHAISHPLVEILMCKSGSSTLFPHALLSRELLCHVCDQHMLRQRSASSLQPQCTIPSSGHISHHALRFVGAQHGFSHRPCRSRRCLTSIYPVRWRCLDLVVLWKKFIYPSVALNHVVYVAVPYQLIPHRVIFIICIIMPYCCALM